MLKSDLVGGGRWCCLTLSCLGREVGACLCPSNPHRLVNSLPSCVPGFLEPSESGPVAGLVPQLSWVLSLVYNWDSKLQILKDPAKHRPAPHFWRRALHCCAWHCAVLEKPLHNCTGAWSLWRSTVKSCDPVICPLLTPLSPAVAWPLLGAIWFFCAWRGNIPSSRSAPGKGMLSPSATPGIPTPHRLPPGFPSFSPGALLPSQV